MTPGWRDNNKVRGNLQETQRESATLGRPEPAPRSGEQQAVVHLWLLEQLHRGESPAVAVLAWPADRAEARRLAGQELPRLLVLVEDDGPLRGGGELSDWVRLPVTDEDFLARLRGLQQRAKAHLERPRLDGSGRLHYRGRCVVLSVTEERLAAALLGRIGGVVRTEVLLVAGWGDDPPTRDGWRAAIFRLRHRCAEIGLDVTSVRSRGYAVRLPST
jgi:hypothetical protein